MGHVPLFSVYVWVYAYVLCMFMYVSVCVRMCANKCVDQVRDMSKYRILREKAIISVTVNYFLILTTDSESAS